MEINKIIEEQFNNVISEEEINEITERASEFTYGISDSFGIKDILSSTTKGESIFNYDQVIYNLKDLLFWEIKDSLVLCVEILSICIIVGILKGLSSSFASKDTAKISLLVCSMVIIGISINSFKDTYQIALDASSIMTNTMELLMPILIGILIATGSITSGTILSPMIIGAITLVSFLIKTILLPALFISTLLTLINCLTEKNYVNKLAKLIRNLSLWTTGIILVVLTGIISVQGLLSETSDGILINTAKYSISSFIPIVGGFTSDTVELFIKCMGTIKNVVGIFGIIIIVLIMAIPLVKILSIAVIYKVTAALTEPITDTKITDGLNEIGSTVISMASIVFFNSLLFVIFITTIINIGGT